MTNNELKDIIKLKQKKFRDEENKFLIEGIHIIEECLASQVYAECIERIYIDDSRKGEKIFDEIPDLSQKAEIEYIPSSSLNKISDTVTPQGILAVVNKPDIKAKFAQDSLIVALDNINDPGNLGTIIRTCHWFGVKSVLLGFGTSDIYNTKTIRATQGSMFRVNTYADVDLAKLLSKIADKGRKVLLTTLTDAEYFDEYIISTQEKYLIVLGNEANGISKDILAIPDLQKIKIRGFSACESLNVATTAGIILNAFAIAAKPHL